MRIGQGGSAWHAGSETLRVGGPARRLWLRTNGISHNLFNLRRKVMQGIIAWHALTFMQCRVSTNHAADKEATAWPAWHYLCTFDCRLHLTPECPHKYSGAGHAPNLALHLAHCTWRAQRQPRRHPHVVVATYLDMIRNLQFTESILSCSAMEPTSPCQVHKERGKQCLVLSGDRTKASRVLPSPPVFSRRGWDTSNICKCNQ